MREKTTLEEYIKHGVYGRPEIKKEEKIQYLGAFRENVIKVLTFEEIQDPAGIFYFKLALKEPHIQKVVLSQNVPGHKRRQIITIAQQQGKDFSIVSSADFIGDNAVVLISKEAINRPDIYMHQKPDIPQEYKKHFNQPLCSKCMKEVRNIHPELPKEYKRLSFFDKIFGRKCSLCQGKK